MSAQSTLTVGGSPPDRVPLGWLILLPLGALLLLQVLFTWFDVVPILNGGLADTDAYMRLVRVLDLHASGHWFDARLLRVNPPEGHVQHWTRFLDALLLGGAWLLEPFYGFRMGLHLWGVLISPVLLALALFALDWATIPILGRDARLFACLAFLLQPSIQAYTIVGRPDHHSLLLALFVVQLGLTFRLLLRPERRPALVAGAIAAVSFWVSPEAVLAIAVTLGALGFYWLQGDLRMSRISRDFMLATTVSLAGLAGDRARPGPPGDRERPAVPGPCRAVRRHRRLLGCWSRAPSAAAGRPGPSAPRGPSKASRSTPFQRRRQPAGLRGLSSRLGLAILGMGVIAAGMAILFPSLRAGPLGHGRSALRAPASVADRRVPAADPGRLAERRPLRRDRAARGPDHGHRARRAAVPDRHAGPQPARAARLGGARARPGRVPADRLRRGPFRHLCPGVAGHPLRRLRRLAAPPDRGQAGAGRGSDPAASPAGRRVVLALWRGRCAAGGAASRPPATTVRSTRRRRSSPAWPGASPRPCSPSPTMRPRCSTTRRSGCSRSRTTGRSPASPRPIAS